MAKQQTCNTELQREHERRLSKIEEQTKEQFRIINSLVDKTTEIDARTVEIGGNVVALKHEIGNGLTARVVKVVQDQTKKLYRNMTIVFGAIGGIWTVIQIVQFIRS